MALWDETVTATIAAPPAMAARVNLFAEQMEGGRARLKRAAEALSQGRTDGALTNSPRSSATGSLSS